MKILDLKCAEYGSKIAEVCDDESLITKSLGVLQEDGVYAFFLYLKWKEKDKQISVPAFDLLKQDFALGHLLSNQPDPLKGLREKLVTDLDSLLFAKELLERAMVYARYHRKALAEKET